jgi:D-alanyl-D-alanine carboxypeptidase/D-alanyl-D-alanine-endopeptidase (penicillin-binding protein 4)
MVPVRTLALVAACVCGLLLASAAAAKAPSLTGQLRQSLAAPGVSPASAAAMAIDLRTGKTVFAQNADLPLQPASNEKLGVAYTALLELGPDYRFHTQVLGEGRRVGHVWKGRLVLKGHGDPTLSSADMKKLARKLERRGIRRVTGRIVADASWFDGRWSVLGWRTSYVNSESAPLSALVVDRGRRDRRPVANPPLAAAAALYRALRERGIEVRSPIVGRAGEAATPLAAVRSQRLARLLTAINADSDNYTAELVLKAIGRQVLGKGTTAAGAAVVRRDLKAAGVPLTGVRVVDGSGLSRANRATARQLAALLVVVWSDPRVRSLFRGSLAVAGISGTLERRLEQRRVRGVVRAKTGTTGVASALSGYVGTRYAFVVVQNGDPIASYAAREAQDRFVRKLASLP